MYLYPRSIASTEDDVRVSLPLLLLNAVELYTALYYWGVPRVFRVYVVCQSGGL
jgi:hypothetical protein